MKDLIENIVVNVMTEKQLKGIEPLSVNLNEIKASPLLDEAIKDVMRALAISGSYKAGLTIGKVPMLIYNKQ